MIPSLLGNLPDWDEIKKIADRHSLLIIEDSADTLGAVLRGESTGTRSHVSTTSFYGSHVINCAGNGGMVCVDDDDWYTQAKLLRSWGRSSSLIANPESIESRFNVVLDGVPYDTKFVFEEMGYNLEPSEAGAAFGLVQLSKLKSNIDARVDNFAQQLAFFADYEDYLVLPREIAESRTGWLAFPLTVRETAPFTRRDFQIFFEQRNIQTRTIMTGNVLRQPGFARIDRKEAPGGYPMADEAMAGGVMIACHHGLVQRQIDHVHDTFREFIKKFG
jgi:CDP-6-deoxy-D-xylo-4-hexulose-3-dehydrase